jgi:hypothetical protein
VAFDLTYLNIKRAFVAALRAPVDAGRNRSGSELFSAESAATMDTYVKVFKPGLGYMGIICHGGGSFLVRSWFAKTIVRGKASL